MKARCLLEWMPRLLRFLLLHRSTLIKVSILGFLLVLVAIAAEIGFGILPYYHLDAFEGKVVDLDTREPIAGAVVLVVDHRTGGISPAGSRSIAANWREVLTDAKGEFKVPKLVEWFGAKRGYLRGQLMIFKPGYGTLRDKRAEAIGANKSWPPPGRFIIYALPRLQTREERVPDLFLGVFTPWQECPNLLRLFNEERINLGLEPLPGDPAQNVRKKPPVPKAYTGPPPLSAGPEKVTPRPHTNR